MRYELIRLAQLIFALALMFGAFLFGIGVGWWRWKRDPTAPAQRHEGLDNAAIEPLLSAGTFTAELRDDEVVLAPPVFDTSAQATSPGRRKSDAVPTFAAATDPPRTPEPASIPPPPEVGPAEPMS